MKHLLFLWLTLIGFTTQFPNFAIADNQSPPEKTYPVKVSDNLTVHAPLKRPITGSPVDIVYLNFRDNDSLVNEAAKELAKKIPKDTQLIVIIGDKANGLGVLTAFHAKLPWIILTGKDIPEEPIKTLSYHSVTSGHKKMSIYKDQLNKIDGKKIVILDDLVSSGNTMKVALKLLQESSAIVLKLICAFTEENNRTQLEGYALAKIGHLPVFSRYTKDTQ